MRRILYNDEVLYDPVLDIQVSISTVSSIVSGAGGGNFIIYPSHHLFNKLVPMDATKELIFLDDKREIFRGRITAQNPKIDGSKSVSFEGVSGYLNDVSIRPYGTYPDTPDEGEQPLWTTIAPSTRRDYAEWLISEFNKYSDGTKQFKIGINDLSAEFIRRSSTTRNSVRQEIQDKLIDYFNCFYIAYNYNGERFIDFRTDGGYTSTQTIEFGENLLDYSLDESYINAKTCIIPRGRPENGDEFGIESYPNGPVSETVTKQGDRLMRTDLLSVYGILEETRSYDVDGVTALMTQSVAELATEEVSINSLSISAIDLSKKNPHVSPINVGDWVTISAKPLNFHSEMVCIEIKYDIGNPANDRFIFGAELQTMSTGNKDFASRIRKTEAVIIEKTDPLAKEIKETAKELKEKSKTYNVKPETPYNDGDGWNQGDIRTETVSSEDSETLLLPNPKEISNLAVDGNFQVIENGVIIDTIKGGPGIELRPVDEIKVQVDEVEHEIDLQGNELYRLPNGVHDELVGNKIVRRVRKRVFDGSENWDRTSTTTANYYRFRVFLEDARQGSSGEDLTLDFICPSLPTVPLVSPYNNVEGISLGVSTPSSRMILYTVMTSQMTLAQFKAYLAANPLTVYYELATPIEIDLPITYPSIQNAKEVEITPNVPTTISWLYTREVGGMYIATTSRTSQEEFSFEDWEKVAGTEGKDAILLNMTASNGTVLKNSEGSTTWEITIFRGEDEITNIAQLKSLLGEDARIIWKVKWSALDDYELMDPDDARILDGGFKMVADANDISIQAVFKAELEF